MVPWDKDGETTGIARRGLGPCVFLNGPAVNGRGPTADSPSLCRVRVGFLDTNEAFTTVGGYVGLGSAKSRSIESAKRDLYSLGTTLTWWGGSKHWHMPNPRCPGAGKLEGFKGGLDRGPRGPRREKGAKGVRRGLPKPGRRARVSLSTE